MAILPDRLSIICQLVAISSIDNEDALPSRNEELPSRRVRNLSQQAASRMRKLAVPTWWRFHLMRPFVATF